MPHAPSFLCIFQTYCFPSPCGRLSRIWFYSFPCYFRFLRLLWKLRCHALLRVQAISVQSNQNNSFPYCRVRLSPFTHYSWLPCLEYSAVIQNGNTTAKTLHVSTPFVQGQSYVQALAIVQAIQLLPSYTNFHSRNKDACQEILITSLLPAYNRQQHATLPVLFPKSDKLQNDRLWISPR